MTRRALLKLTVIGMIGVKIAITKSKPIIGSAEHIVMLIQQRKLYKVLQTNAMRAGDNILEAFYRTKQMNIKYFVNSNFSSGSYQTASKLMMKNH